MEIINKINRFSGKFHAFLNHNNDHYSAISQKIGQVQNDSTNMHLLHPHCIPN